MRPNRDVIINSSILILAIVIVIERIPSVDTGILPKDVGRQPRKVGYILYERTDMYLSELGVISRSSRFFVWGLVQNLSDPKKSIIFIGLEIPPR